MREPKDTKRIHTGGFGDSLLAVDRHSATLGIFARLHLDGHLSIQRECERVVFWCVSEREREGKRETSVMTEKGIRDTKNAVECQKRKGMREREKDNGQQR